MEVLLNSKRRFLPTHSTLVAYLALFVALGGTTYAAVSLPKNSIGTKQLKNGAVTSSKLNVHATISNANHAAKANHAANADRLGGSPATDFRLHCPNGMLEAGNLCVDLDTRPPATLPNALATCASAQMRLADAGELALAFNNIGASQDPEWTGATFFDGTTETGQLLSNTSSRQIVISSLSVNITQDYRCVSSPSN
jgi:hypothetical protein